MGAGWSADWLQQMDDELHALSQPMTALQVRLELGLVLGNEAALREAVEGALEEAGRLFRAMQLAKATLLRMEQERIAAAASMCSEAEGQGVRGRVLEGSAG